MKYILVASLSIVAIGGTSKFALGQLPVSDMFDAEITVVEDLGIKPEFRGTLTPAENGELTGLVEIGSGEAWIPLKSVTVPIPAAAQTGIKLATAVNGVAPAVTLEIDLDETPPLPDLAPVVHMNGATENTPAS